MNIHIQAKQILKFIHTLVKLI